MDPFGGRRIPNLVTVRLRMRSSDARFHNRRDVTCQESIYEKLVCQSGHQVKHYRADNGRFADKAFHQSVNENDQTLDFCGVGAHHQNGLIENRNKALTLGARTLLLHGMRMWPKMITTMFWPFAMKAFAERMNSLHMDSSGETPESKMYGVPSEGIPVKNFHTLFCPVYVLDARLQSAGGAGPPKWHPRARIGVYLGHSPMHAGNVALVFNPKLVLVPRCSFHQANLWRVRRKQCMPVNDLHCWVDPSGHLCLRISLDVDIDQFRRV